MYYLFVVIVLFASILFSWLYAIATGDWQYAVDISVVYGLFLGIAMLFWLMEKKR